MVTTITLNPCIDKTVHTNILRIGELNRVTLKSSLPGGKGINVSTCLKQLGIDTQITGFNFCIGEEKLKNFAARLGIGYHMLTLPGTLRTNTKVFSDDKCMTELNEYGSSICMADIEKLKANLSYIIPGSDIAVISGSIPPLKDADQDYVSGIYADLCRYIHDISKDTKIIVDAEGDILRRTAECRPYMIKANRKELEGLIQRSFTSIDDIAGLLSEYTSYVRYICLSLGKEGAYLINKDDVIYQSALPVDVKGLQGAGDSMVAGICYALENKLGDRDMLSCGIAAATGSVEREGTLLCEKDRFDYYLSLIK